MLLLANKWPNTGLQNTKWEELKVSNGCIPLTELAHDLISKVSINMTTHIN